MIKKILFFTITIVVGVVLAYTTYYSSYVNHVYDIVETALKEERYEDVARMFTSYFDAESKVQRVDSEEGFILVYPSILQTTKTSTDGKSYTGFEKGYSVYGFSLKDTSFADITVSKDTTKNDSGIIYNGRDSQSYSYPFVVKTGDNPYDLTSTISSLKCVEANIGEKDINEKLGGSITSISLLNSNGETIINASGLNLDLSEEFFTYADELIAKHDECAPTNDKDTFNPFFEEWKTRYLAANENYKMFYSTSDIKPTSLLWKTVGIMVMYVAVCVLIGLLIFKGGKLFNRNKNSTRYQKRAPMKGNTTKVNSKDIVDASITKETEVKEEETVSETDKLLDDAKKPLEEDTKSNENE